MIKKILSLGLFLFAGGQANAALLDLGGFTADTNSGLDWLDLTATQSLSYNELVVATGPGGAFEEYRLATVAEVDTLFIAAGLPASGNETTDFAAVNALIGLVGSTSTQDGFLEAFGITATPGISSGHRVVSLDYFTRDPLSLYGLFNGLTYGDSFGPDIAGGWLVRPTVVPLPPAAWLFGAALLLLWRRASPNGGRRDHG